jgi:2-keto-3-deoxy-L-rhamnonate aldolase RhmA
MTNRLRAALHEGEMSLGAWVQVGHPAVAEVFARAGFDWVCADLEHGAMTLESAVGLFRCLGGGCTAVARVPANDPVWIRRCLDGGAGGIIVPMVNSAEQAEAAVRAAKLPPRGERGFGYCRANAYGVDFHDYAKTANDEIAVVVQIEHKDAIASLDAILSVDGVDAAFIGPYDLTGSMGMPGRLDHPAVAAALDAFLGACKQHDVVPGAHVVHPTPDAVRKALADGYRLLALGVDTVFLHEASVAALRAARPDAGGSNAA